MVLTKLTAFVVMLILALPAMAAQTPAYTADKHKAHGLDCGSCHGEGPKQPVDQSACLKCHESMQAVAKRTVGLNPNPHDNHMSGQAECTQCHNGHQADQMMCSQCHPNMKFERKR